MSNDAEDGGLLVGALRGDVGEPELVEVASQSSAVRLALLEVPGAHVLFGEAERGLVGDAARVDAEGECDDEDVSRPTPSERR